jgi:hypothetical protein
MLMKGSSVLPPIRPIIGHSKKVIKLQPTQSVSQPGSQRAEWALVEKDDEERKYEQLMHHD